MLFHVSYKIDAKPKNQLIDADTAQEAKGLFWEYFDKIEKKDCHVINEIVIIPVISRTYLDSIQTDKDLNEVALPTKSSFLFS